MDDKRIAELRKICDAATDGPWETDDYAAYVYGGDTSPIVEIRGFGAEASGKRPDGSQESNATFIATARTALPEALDEITRLKSLLSDVIQNVESGGLVLEDTLTQISKEL